MKILFVAATLPEIEPFGVWLDEQFARTGPGHYQNGPLHVSLLLSGVGMPLMGYAMGRVLAMETYDLAVNAGIAGALNRKLPLGEVVEVTREYMADLGAEDRDGTFLPAEQLGFFDAENTVFEDGWLANPYSEDFDLLPKASGISVNRVHGCESSIESLRSRITADVESMEGAAFFYACLQAEIPFLEIRAISNYVEARNRAAWKVGLAVNRLNDSLIELLASL